MPLIPPLARKRGIQESLLERGPTTGRECGIKKKPHPKMWLVEKLPAPCKHYADSDAACEGANSAPEVFVHRNSLRRTRTETKAMHMVLR